jgi:hypothetical protein
MLQHSQSKQRELERDCQALVRAAKGAKANVPIEKRVQQLEALLAKATDLIQRASILQRST